MGHIAMKCVQYPLADVSVQIAGKTFTDRAGVSEHLPVQMLLGHDAPDLLSLLKEGEQDDPDRVVGSELVAVTMRAQSRRVEAEEFGSQQKPIDQASTVAKDCVVDTHTEIMGANFDDDMIEGGRTRDHLTKRQKREGRGEHAAEKAAKEAKVKWGVLDMTTDALRQLQLEDSMLLTVRSVADGHKGLSGGEGFYYHDGLLYRQWMPRGGTGGSDSGTVGSASSVLSRRHGNCT